MDNNIESCTTYNVLKLGRAAFSWSLDLDALEFNERNKFSGMHGTMHPTLPGRVIYMLPTRGRKYSRRSQPFRPPTHR
jgi:hypothetical protein